MTASRLTSSMTVAEVLEQWPETVPVFQELKTACVGCTMAPFDSLADVARIYKLDLEQVFAALSKAINTENQQDNMPSSDSRDPRGS